MMLTGLFCTRAASQSDITNTGGIVSAQFTDSPAGEGIQKVIDNVSTTKYLTFHNSGWIQYQAMTPFVVSKYSITSANDAPERDPLTWSLLGSTNGTTWLTIDTRTNEDFPTRSQRREFTFSNLTPYAYYRLQMSNNSGTVLQLAEWEIFGVTGVASAFQHTSYGGIGKAIGPGSYTLAQMQSLGLADNWISSVKVATGYRITLYENDNFGGSSVSKTADDASLVDDGWNDRASSMRVAAVVTTPPLTWQEHWFEHNQVVSRVFYDDDVVIYYDNDMDRSVTWLNSYVGNAWRYSKQIYGNMNSGAIDQRLWSVFHQNKYGGGHPSYYWDGSHDFRNVIDVGQNGSWANATGWPLDATIHEIGHIVESTTNNAQGSPSFPLWGDSQWCVIYQYDVYVALGWNSEAQRWYNQQISSSASYPRANSFWFRDWFYPIWNTYGKSAVLARYFRLLSQYFPKNGQQYSRNLNWGEFVHFWSGAAGVNLKPLATTAFGWPADWETQFNQARIDFPFTYGDAGSGRSATSAENELKQEASAESPMSIWPNPASGSLSIMLPAQEKVASVNLSSMKGSAVLDYAGSGGVAVVDVSALPKGLYVVTVVSDVGKIRRKKIVVSNP